MLKKMDEAVNIALFPFKNLSLYKKDFIIEAAKTSGEERKGYTAELVNKVRRNLICRYSVRNNDEIKLMLKKYYPFIFDEYDIEKNLLKDDMDVYDYYVDILYKFTRSLLSNRDGKIVYKHWKSSIEDEFIGPYEELDKVNVFYDVNRIISMDLLFCIYYVKNNIITKDERSMFQLNKFYSMVGLADKQLEKVLSRGISENHIHASAAFNFCLSWDVIMNQRINEDEIEKIVCNEFASSEFEKNTAFYFKMAYVSRGIMALFLKESSKGKNIKEWSRERFKNSAKMIEFLNNEKDCKFHCQFLNEVIEELNQTIGTRGNKREDDLMFYIFPQYKSLETYGENIFLVKSMIYIKEQLEHNRAGRKGDVSFCERFFQYIRIKNETYQQIVQGEGIKGLTFFQEYFERAKMIIWKSFECGKEYSKLMMKTLFHDENLKKLELRVSVGKDKNDFIKKVSDLLEAYYEIIREDYLFKDNRDEPIPRVGIVFHLIRDQEEDGTEHCWLKHKYVETHSGNIYKEQVDMILKIREDIPYLSHFLVGLDVASNEHVTPIDVFAPVYNKVREENRDVMIHRGYSGDLIEDKSFSFTFHVGEEFRHVVSGLRRIDEVLEKCKFLSGDRIGHAIALGVDVEYWRNFNPIVIIPRGEVLDNMLWLWGVYSQEENINLKILFYIQEEIYKLAGDIFHVNTGLDTKVLFSVYNERFKPFKISKDIINSRPEFCIKNKGFKNFTWTKEKLLHAYKCGCFQKKIMEPIFVRVKNIDIEIIKQAQSILRNKIADRGVVVEVNPTSNTTVGEMKSVFHNQAFQINSISGGEDNNVMFSINSDDPLIFNTNISNEYAYIYYGLLSRGTSREAALQWINNKRECGIDSSFTEDRISDRKYLEYLKGALKGLGRI